MYSTIPISKLDISQIDYELAKCKIELAEAGMHEDEERKVKATKRMEDLQAAKASHEHYQFVVMPQTIIDRSKAGIAAQDVFNKDKPTVQTATNTQDPVTAAFMSKHDDATCMNRKAISKAKTRTGKAYSGLKATMQSKLKEYKVTKPGISKTVVGKGSNKFFITGGPL